MEQEIFSVGGETYYWADLMAGAELRGDLDPIWQRSAIGLASESEAEAEEVELDLQRLQSAADALRYRFNLITAEETERWLATRKLTVEDFEDHLVRRTWRDQLADQVDPATAPREAVLEILWPDTIFYDCFDGLAVAMARRAVIAQTEPLLSGAIDGVEERLCRRLRVSSDQLPAWYEQSLFLGPRIKRHLALEARYDQQARELLTPERLERELAARQLLMTRVTAEVAVFDDANVAKEAYFCVANDGDSLEMIAGQTGGGYQQQEVLLEDIPGQLADRMTSATPGQVIGPIVQLDRYWVYRVRDKAGATLDDPRIRARLEQRLLRSHFDDQVASTVTWHLWRPGS